MDCIKENLRFTKLDQRAFTLTKDVLLALQQLDGEKIFDIVFMDPPYDLGFEKNVLEYLAESQLLEEDAIVIVEASKQTDFSYINDIGFTLIKEKLYKTNKHVFLEKITR